MNIHNCMCDRCKIVKNSNDIKIGEMFQIEFAISDFSRRQSYRAQNIIHICSDCADYLGITKPKEDEKVMTNEEKFFTVMSDIMYDVAVDAVSNEMSNRG